MKTYRNGKWGGFSMKDLFDKLQSIMSRANGIEDDLQALRDQVDALIKPSINDSIRAVHDLRDILWKVDKAMEIQAESSKDADALFKELDKDGAPGKDDSV